MGWKGTDWRNDVYDDAIVADALREGPARARDIPGRMAEKICQTRIYASLRRLQAGGRVVRGAGFVYRLTDQGKLSPMAPGSRAEFFRELSKVASRRRRGSW